MEDADSISFWYKIAAFAQYNIPKKKKGRGVTQYIFIRVLKSVPLPFYTPFFTINEPLSNTLY